MYTLTVVGGQVPRSCFSLSLSLPHSLPSPYSSSLLSLLPLSSFSFSFLSSLSPLFLSPSSGSLLTDTHIGSNALDTTHYRLVNPHSNSSTPDRGRVEVQYFGVWGTICDDYWDLDDADVICKLVDSHCKTNFLGPHLIF